jgi:hypothetical protein
VAFNPWGFTWYLRATKYKPARPGQWAKKDDRIDSAKKGLWWGNKVVTSQRGCWAREFLLEEEDIKARCYIWLKSQARESLLEGGSGSGCPGTGSGLAVCSSCTRLHDLHVALAGENEGVATALQKQETEEQKVEQKKHRDALGFS